MATLGPSEAAPAARDAAVKILGDVLRGDLSVLDGLDIAWVWNVNVQRALRIALELRDAGTPVDFTTVSAAFMTKHERYPAELADIVTQSAYGNAQAYIDIIHKDWQRRERERIGHQIHAEAADPERAASLSELIASVSAPRKPKDEEWLSGAELMERDVSGAQSLLGDRALIRGGFAILAGASGMGKTFIALQLMRSLCEGSTWLDAFWVGQPLRVGLIELEMPLASIKERISGLRGPWLDNCSIWCMPTIPLDLTERSSVARIENWIRSNRLDVVIADPWNQMGVQDENKASDTGKALNGIHRLRARTGCAFIVLHHVTKTDAKDAAKAEALQPKTVVMNMLRGSGRLSNDPDTIIGMLEAPGQRVRMVWAKTRHGITPGDMHLKRGVGGYLEPSEAAVTEKSRATEDKIEKYILTRGAPGPTAKEIAVSLRISEDTVMRHLKSMGNVQSDNSRPRRWSIILTPEPEQGGLLDEYDAFND